MESLQERNITSAISESVLKTWMYWNGSFQLWKIVNEIYFLWEENNMGTIILTGIIFLFLSWLLKEK